MKVSLERRSVHVAEWIVYLVASSSIGIGWSSIYAQLNRPFMGAASSDWVTSLEDVAPWSLGASLVIGLLYRLFAYWKKRRPSLWFATLIPGIGALFFLGMIRGRMESDFEDSIMGLVATLAITYACGGIVLIPLSMVHTKALEWIHVRLTQWAPRASIRSIRQVGYATICGCFLAATELPQYLDHRAHDYALSVGEIYGVKMPRTAYALSSRDTVDSATYVPVQDAHFRVPGGTTWPPTQDAIDMTRGESPGDVRQRIQDVTGHEVPLASKLEQVKWYEPGGWVEASRLRTPEADYVEFRRR